MKSKKKLVIFTIEEGEFVNELLKPLVNQENYEISHVYISKSLFSFKKLKKNLKFFLSNKYPFCISLKDLFLFSLQKIKNILINLFSLIIQIISL